jgi:hypothetical protein
LGLLSVDLPIGIVVALVADQDPDCLPGAVLLNLADPVLDVLITLPIAQVKHQDDSLGALVVGRCYGLELLLPSSIPHLQLDHAALAAEGSNLEVHSDGRVEGLLENIVGESEEKAGFAHRGVADQQDLENKVVIR